MTAVPGTMTRIPHTYQTKYILSIKSISCQYHHSQLDCLQTKRYVHHQQQHLEQNKSFSLCSDWREKKKGRQKKKKSPKFHFLFSSRCERRWLYCFSGKSCCLKAVFPAWALCLFLLMPQQGIEISCRFLSSFSAIASLANQIFPVSYLGQ